MSKAWHNKRCITDDEVWWISYGPGSLEWRLKYLGFVEVSDD